MGRGRVEEMSGRDMLATLGWGRVEGLTLLAGELSSGRGRLGGGRSCWRNITDACPVKTCKDGLFGDMTGFLLDKDKSVILEVGRPNFPAHRG